VERSGGVCLGEKGPVFSARARGKKPSFAFFCVFPRPLFLRRPGRRAGGLCVPQAMASTRPWNETAAAADEALLLAGEANENAFRPGGSRLGSRDGGVALALLLQLLAQRAEAVHGTGGGAGRDEREEALESHLTDRDWAVIGSLIGTNTGSLGSGGPADPAEDILLDALDLVDRGAVSRVFAEGDPELHGGADLGATVVQGHAGRSGRSEHLIYDNVHFCSCEGFHTAAGRGGCFSCSHVLAARIALALGSQARVRTVKLSREEFVRMLCVPHT
jgi:hypothetical protein